jgi:hypothetical protein
MALFVTGNSKRGLTIDIFDDVLRNDRIPHLTETGTLQAVSGIGYITEDLCRVMDNSVPDLAALPSVRAGA